MNLTLSLIHPDLYRTGLEILRKLRDSEATTDIAQEWQSVYTGIAVMCNRLTPFHRDTKGRPEWYDVLLSYSDQGSCPELQIEDIGLGLQYESGAVVGLCGSVFKHGVGVWGVGNRICYAHFMRESVRDRFDVAPAGWVYRNKYFPAEGVIGQADGCIVDEQNSDSDKMEL